MSVECRHVLGVGKLSLLRLHMPTCIYPILKFVMNVKAPQMIIYVQSFNSVHHRSVWQQDEGVYWVALNFCGSLILRMADFWCFAGTNFCDWEKLVFLAGD